MFKWLLIFIMGCGAHIGRPDVSPHLCYKQKHIEWPTINVEYIDDNAQLSKVDLEKLYKHIRKVEKQLQKAESCLD